MYSKTIYNYNIHLYSKKLLLSFLSFFCATKSSLLGDKLFLKLAGDWGLSRAEHPVQYIISLITQKICKSI